MKKMIVFLFALGMLIMSGSQIAHADPWAATASKADSVPASGITAGNAPATVCVSSVAVNAVRDESIVGVAASKIAAGQTGASVQVSSVAINAIGREQLKDDAVGADELDDTGEYTAMSVAATTATVSGVQTIPGSAALPTTGAPANSLYSLSGVLYISTEAVSGAWSWAKVGGQ